MSQSKSPSLAMALFGSPGIRLVALRAIAAVALSVVSQGVAAQVSGAIPPQLSQLPPPPSNERVLPDIRMERPGAEPDVGRAGPSFLVSALHITGETRFSETELVAASGYTAGSRLSVPDLRRIAGRITAFYNKRGFIVAQAYLPAQEIKDGAVTIVVIEGHYGAVTINNHSRLRTGVARGVLRGLDSGQIVAAVPLERRLLLLSDVPGVGVRSTLSPGSTLGTSDLRFDLASGPRLSGEVEADNAGNPYTGFYQGGGTLNINNPLGIGDLASVRVLTSGEGLQYVRGAYQVQVGQGTVGAAYAAFHYHLGKQFESLGAHGSEQIASVYASYPLVRSYNDNLWAHAQFDHRTFQDVVDFSHSQVQRRADVGVFGLSGDHRDAAGGGGSESYSVYVSVGDLDIETPAARVTDAATARSQGGYEKLYASFDRVQPLVGAFSLYGLVRGQVASKNLDTSEKMELGGAYAVRAYPEGEAYGDEGYVATVEARVWLPPVIPALRGRWQFAAFLDTGWVRFAQTPWYPGVNSATRTGAGVGLTWVQPNNFLVRASYAHRVGTPPATSYPSSSGQFWFEVVKFF